MKTNIQNITFTALMTAVLCILGPVVLPIGPVPMSFANLVIYLTVILLDKKRATSCVAVYLLMGMVGIPVFAGFTGGVGKLFGPTGGYLVGYLVLSWSAGAFLEIRKKKFLYEDERRCSEKKSENENKFIVEKSINEVGKKDNDKNLAKKKKAIEQLYQAVALGVGTLLMYALGTLWLMHQSNMSFQIAFGVGVVPFLFFDILKIVVAVLLGNAIKVRILHMLF